MSRHARRKSTPRFNAPRSLPLAGRRPVDLLQRLQADNRRILLWLERLDGEVARRDEPEQPRLQAAILVRELQRLLRRHGVLEDSLLFPRLRHWAPGMERALQAMSRERSGIDGLLAKLLQELPHGDERPGTRAVLNLIAVSNAIQSHIVGEELELYALARRRIPRHELKRLGKMPPLSSLHEGT